MPEAALDILTPRAYVPLLEPKRYKGARGGRGSGKSHFFGESAIEQAIMRPSMRPKGWEGPPGLRMVCIRETQKDLKHSSKQLIEDKIIKFGAGSTFDVMDAEIRTPGDGIIIFQGMQAHNAESIKSLERFDVAWVEEAQSLSARSLRLLRPTMRTPGAEMWFSWNPDSAEDPVDDLFFGPNAIGPDMASVVHTTWRDNPWFDETDLVSERLVDLKRNPDEYDHIWEGGYVTISDAIIFKNRVSVEEFDTPPGVRFFHGCDWGFAVDPTAAVRCFVKDDCLYIDQEAYGHQVELDDTGTLFDLIPTIRKWPLKADNARPETISYMKRHGFPMIGAADKWKGSVEDGIACLKAFKRIIVHERCIHTAKEFRLYSYKVDKHTGDVLPIIVDAWNHIIDALRYALDGYIQGRGRIKVRSDVLERFRTPRRVVV